MESDNKAKDRAERMMSDITTFDKQEAMDFITNVVEEIETPPRRVPENVFREVFLPVFIETSPEVQKRTGEYLAHWIGVVGSPFERAEVVDVQGNRLFTVPAIYDSSELDITRDEKARTRSFGAIFKELEETAAVNPMAAKMEYCNAMVGKLDKMFKNQHSSVKEWEAVFQHYGLIEKSEEAGNETSPGAASIDDDFVL